MSPSRAPRPCSRAGCPALLDAGSWCSEHQPVRAPRHKSDAARAFYNSTAWKRARAVVRANQILCVRCKVRPSGSVHHKNAGDLWDLRFDPNDPDASNLEALCWECHNSLSGSDHAAKRNCGGDR